MNVFLIGVGLIGGSFAKDLRKFYPQASFYGISRKERTLDKALELGIIDHKATMEELSLATIVIISIPVDVTIPVLVEVLDRISDDCLVFDAGSIKESICLAVQNHPKRKNYLACHPIAGTEFSGPDAALEGLYDQKTMIICEVEATSFKLQELAVELFRAIGMRIRYMNAKSHDKHIAYVSHLSHISSFMLGKTVIEKEKNENDIFDMAGSGFESTVRLAKSSPAMWTPIFAENKSNVIEALEEYISNLTAFKELMKTNAFEAVYDEMEQTNKIKDILNGIPHNN